MSNTWFYEVLIPAQEFLSKERIEKVLSLAKAIGYSPINLITERIFIMSLSGIESVEFDNQEKSMIYLEKEGGNLTLWKEPELNFGLTFAPSTNITLGRLIISIAHAHFRHDTPERLGISKDLLRLFVEICNTLETPYAYSVDEDAVEEFWSDLTRLEDVVEKLRRPPILHWLNYFSAQYAAQFDTRAFRELGGTVIKLHSGILVSFFEYPWDVNLSKLRDLNHKWRQRV